MSEEIIIPESVKGFAEEFSKNYKELTVGTYQTDDGDFKIEYKDWVDDNLFSSSQNTASVSYSGELILWKNNLANYSPDYIFYTIIWCYVMQQDECKDRTKSDLIALQFSLKSGKSKKILAQEILTGFGKAEEIPVARWEALSSFIKTYITI